MANTHIPRSKVKEAPFPYIVSTCQVEGTTPICPLTVTIFRAVAPFQFSPFRKVLRAIVCHPSVADLLLGLIKVTGAGKVIGGGEGAELCRVGPAHRGEAGVGQTEHARVPKEKYCPLPQPGVVSDQVLLLRQGNSGVEQVFINALWVKPC